MKREDLINTKVYVDGRSVEIQKKLFELGFSWTISRKKVSYTDAPFLFICRDCTISFSHDMDSFIGNDFQEIKVDDILNIPVEPKCEPKFEPFQKVLVRDHDAQEWRPQFFSYFKGEYEEYAYVGMGDSYKEMIPYEGNEHLLYTTNDPDIHR